MSDDDKPDATGAGPGDDDAAYDAALGALYRAGEAELPPPAVDRAVLAAAARAAGARGSGGRRRRWMWPAATGLSSAAAVLLGLALVLESGGGGTTPAAPQPDRDVAPAASPAASPAPAASALESAREDAAPERLETRATWMPDTSLKRQQAADDGAPAALAEAAALPPAPPAGVRYRDPACPGDLAVPDGALLRPVAGGLEITTPDRAYRMVCTDGRWVRQEPGGD